MLGGSRRNRRDFNKKSERDVEKRSEENGNITNKTHNIACCNFTSQGRLLLSIRYGRIDNDGRYSKEGGSTRPRRRPEIFPRNLGNNERTSPPENQNLRWKGLQKTREKEKAG